MSMTDDRDTDMTTDDQGKHYATDAIDVVYYVTSRDRGYAHKVPEC